MNYLSVLNLTKEPFSTSPDPSFFFRSSEHLSALNRLEIAIRLKRGLSIILGDVGTGKTTIARALLQIFHEEPQYVFHMILDPDFRSEYQFLSHLTKLFGVSPFFRSSIDHRDSIEKYLFEKCVEEEKTVVLVIDEGQKLKLPDLEILRILLNYETNDRKLLQLVILAQLEFLPKIKRVKNFLDRVCLKYILKPLSEEETTEMIYFRLHQAGFPNGKDLFMPGALRRIYEYTQGYPRQITLICHNCLEHLVMSQNRLITEKFMEGLLMEEVLWQ